MKTIFSVIRYSLANREKQVYKIVSFMLCFPLNVFLIIQQMWQVNISIIITPNNPYDIYILNVGMCNNITCNSKIYLNFVFPFSQYLSFIQNDETKCARNFSDLKISESEKKVWPSSLKYNVLDEMKIVLVAKNIMTKWKIYEFLFDFLSFSREEPLPSRVIYIICIGNKKLKRIRINILFFFLFFFFKEKSEFSIRWLV